MTASLEPTASGEYLELADWRRRVAEMWAAWRERARDDPAAATLEFRAAKDVLFRDHPQSPLPAEERRSFRGLAYWPYEEAWRMTVRLEPAAATPTGGVFPPMQPIGLPSSGAQAFSFRRVGSVALNGPLQGRSIGAFWLEGYAGGLFVAFRDATSGGATYGAGRYLLDTIKSADHGGDPEQGTLILDFNMAYHPSCAYDPRWACPLAPPENRLPVPVEAGERLRA